MTAQPQRILIADDEPLFLTTTADLLRRAGFQCRTAVDADEALKTLAGEEIDLMIVDLNMPGNLELELLNTGRAIYPDIPIIVATGAPSLQSAIDSVRLKISNYLLKPIKFDELLQIVRQTLASRKPTHPVHSSHEQDGGNLLLGDSPQIRDVHQLIRRAATTDASVLITGESGTGKELAAQTLHRNSPRSNSPFVTIDCTAIPESLFESVLFGHAKGAFTGAVSDQPGLLKGADGGTVFLDEIGELPLTCQSKLLRLIQHATFTPVGQAQPISVNVRFVAATNRNLEEEVNAGRFRRDLYYRLAVVPVSMPPLRDRGSDIAVLANHFLHQLQSGSRPQAAEFSLAAIDCLQLYTWPGNVRELRNVVERVVTLSTTRVIDLDDLPAALQNATSPQPLASDEDDLSRGKMLFQADRLYLEDLLREHGGNVSQSATKAGLTRQGFYKLLAKHGIDPANYRAP